MKCVMGVDERIGSPVRRSEIEMINQCMQECDMMDVKAA